MSTTYQKEIGEETISEVGVEEEEEEEEEAEQEEETEFTKHDRE